MDNSNMNNNEDDKYTNYTYQGSNNQYQSDAPQYQGQSEPNTYSEPKSYQAPDDYQSNSYQNNGYQNNGYQNNSYQNSGYQNSGYQNNGYQNNGYQNNGYQNNGYQNNGYNYNNGYNQGQTNYNYTGGYDNVPRKQSNGTAIGAMVCGIASIVLSCCWGVGFIPAIIAIVLSCKFKKSNNGQHCGQSTAGLICGIIGLIISILSLAYYIMVVVFAVGELGDALSTSIYYNW